MALLTLLVVVSPLEYTNSISYLIVNLVVFFGFITFVFVLKKSISKVYFAVFGLFTIIVLMKFIVDSLSFGSGYKTQDILYRQINNSSIRVEYVWEDIGALGYNKTYQKVIPITPLFEWRTTIDPSNLDKSSWKEVNEYVNELGLKGG